MNKKILIIALAAISVNLVGCNGLKSKGDTVHDISDVLENAQTTTTSFNQVTEAEQPKPNLDGNVSSESTFVGNADEKDVSKEPVYKMDGLRKKSVVFADLVPDEERAYTFWVYFNENMPDLEIVGPSSIYHISGKDWVIEHGEYVLEDIGAYTSVASLTLINPEGGEWYRSWISHSKTPFSFMVTESWV